MRRERGCVYCGIGLHQTLFINRLLSSRALLGLFVIFKEGIIVFAFRNILRCITLLGSLVVNKTQLTALLSGGDTVQTDEELGAVVGISVLGMRVKLTKLINGSLLGALETTLGLVRLSLALFPVSDLGPVANTGELVEPEAGRAGVLLGEAVNAGVEDVAHRGVGVSVETIQPGAQVVGSLGGLELEPVTAVNIEIMITRFPLPGERIKD